MGANMLKLDSVPSRPLASLVSAISPPKKSVDKMLRLYRRSVNGLIRSGLLKINVGKIYTCNHWLWHQPNQRGG
jgi:hypothetical protein